MSQPLHVVVGVIENHLGQVLVAKRPEGKRYGNHWEFPGGKVEPGENAQAALARELEEELGIEVLACESLMDFTDPFAGDRVRLDVWRVTRFLGALSPMFEAMVGAEGQPLRWVALAQLEALQFPPANAAVIKRLILPQYYAITTAPECGDLSLETEILSFVQEARKTQEAWLGRHRPCIFQLRAHGLSDEAFALCLSSLAAMPPHIVLNRGAVLLEWVKAQGSGMSPDSLSAYLIKSFGLSARRCGLHLREYELIELFSLLSDAAPAEFSLLMQFRQLVIGHVGYVGASCHNAQALMMAQALGLDYALLSPVQSTQSHPGGASLGWSLFSELAQSVAVPVYALGGLGPEHCSVALTHGAVGVAGVSAFSGQGFVSKSAVVSGN